MPSKRLTTSGQGWAKAGDPTRLSKVRVGMFGGYLLRPLNSDHEYATLGSLTHA